MRACLALVILTLVASSPARAWDVRSHKTGAVAEVAVRFAAKFQSYINDLEAHGARILFMGGYRKGHCSPRHMHPCGRALDVCQTSRDKVARRCHLPPRKVMAHIAKRHGLFEGGQWCHGDYGHAQVGISAPACSEHSLMARRHKRRHHRRHAVLASQ